MDGDELGQVREGALQGGQARSQGKTLCPTLVFTLALSGPAFPSAKSGVRELVFHLIFGS